MFTAFVKQSTKHAPSLKRPTKEPPMLGIKVSIPIACFRKGLTREFLETYDAPPPATCYGFLLSLIGERERERHIGARVTATSLEHAPQNLVLRTVWRVKQTPLGSPGNTRPDYQQLLTGVELIVWLDSSDELNVGPTLEERVRIALDPNRRGEIERFGGLSFGESTHLVDSVSLYEPIQAPIDAEDARIFILDPDGETTLPVWVDHVGSANTRYVVGSYQAGGLTPPTKESIPKIEPKES